MKLSDQTQPNSHPLPESAAPSWLVIASRGRCGTHMLQTSLAAHPDIHCEAELFNPRLAAEEMQTGSGHRVWHDGESVADFLERKRGEAPAGAAWFGLVGQYQQVRRAPEILPALKALQPHVIVLHRRNLLEQFCSAKIAMLTDHWGARSDRDEHPTLELSMFELTKFFRTMDRQRKDDLKFWRGRPLLEVAYEDLVERYQPTMESVFRFLSVPDAPTRPRTTKIERRELHQIIENYDTIARRLRWTRWRRFLR